MEVSFFYDRNKKKGQNELAEFCQNLPLLCMEVCANAVLQVYSFLPEEKPREEQMMFDYLQRVIPKMMRIAQTVKIREIMTYTYDETEQRLEILDFDQMNVFEIRLFDLLAMPFIKDLRRLYVKDSLGIVDDVLQSRRATSALQQPRSVTALSSNNNRA